MIREIVIQLLSIVCAMIAEIYIVGACLDVNNGNNIGNTFRKVLWGENGKSNRRIK